MLKLDFYESGVGETTVVTFPDGGLGVVDGHPSQVLGSPNLQDLTAGRPLHFVCLTHPHADHGAGLIPVLSTHRDIGGFWYTGSDVDVMTFLLQDILDYPNYPSPCREAVVRLKKGWASFLIDLYGAVCDRGIPRHQLRSDVQATHISGVEVHCLGPEEKIIQEFVEAYRRRLTDHLVRLPDPNLLSAILVLKYQDTVVVLGADALKRNWTAAARAYHRLGFGKARVIKVPHHGASNALLLHPRRREHSYLDLCSRDPKAHAVLFAGDAKHPDEVVFDELRRHTDLVCLSNGLKKSGRESNPLQIRLPGARAARLPPVCNSIVSIEVSPDGKVARTAGVCDESCCG